MEIDNVRLVRMAALAMSRYEMLASEQAALALKPQASMTKIYQLKMLETVPYIYG